MKRLMWITVFAALSIALLPPVAAQDDGPIVQLAVPFFTEDILQPVIDQYQAENPGVRVLLNPYQGFGFPADDSDDPEEYLDNLESYVTSADILLVNSELTPEASRAGYLLDMSPLTQSDPAYNEAEFHATILRSFEWDGGQWALPISSTFTVVSYIPAAFDEAGLAYPSESWTLADLELAVRALTQYNADGSIALPGLLVQGFGGTGGNNLSAMFLSMIGQGVYSEATFPNSPDLNNPLLQSHLDSWLQMNVDGLFELPEDADNDDVPILITTPLGFGGGFGNQDDPERATALLPGGRAALNVNGYAISSGTLYPEAAYDLIKYLIHHPNAVTASLGTVPAIRQLDAADSEQGGFGGFLAAAATVSEELEPLLTVALERGLSVADRRFSSGIVTAYNLMQSDGLDAQTALDEAQNQIVTRLVAADNRAATSRIAVQVPNLPTELVAGEISLDFAVLGGGPGFALQGQWQEIADEFAASDPQIGRIAVEPENQFQIGEVAETYDCFYASSNLVPDMDLSQLLSFDPLVTSDPSFDPGDFISGVFDQVRVNNQLWALPVQISPLVLRYNDDLYNQAGARLPQGSWTVSEFEDAIRQIKFVLAEDQFPVELNTAGQSSLLTLVAVYGGLPIDPRTDPPTVNFTDPATLDAIRQVLDLARGGYITFASGGGGPGGGGGGFGGAAQSADPIAVYSNVVNAFSFGGFGGGGGGNAQANNTDGIVTFPRGNQFNAVPFNLGTVYISASTDQPEACYRFLTFLSGSTDIFNSMPARHSQINSQGLMTAQGAPTVDFYRSLADLMEQPNTILLPLNLNAGNFGMTQWLFGVFDRYLADEVVDLEADLRVAEQITRDYLVCLAAIPPFDFAQGNFQSFFQEVQGCQTAVDPSAS